MSIRQTMFAIAVVPFVAATANAQDRSRTGAADAQVVGNYQMTTVEKDALAFRRLQSELMVAALSCNHPIFKSHYNRFVLRFRPALKHNGKVLKSYFHRRYGRRGGQRQLDAYITRVANEASLDSMGNPNFCTQSLTRFEAINNSAQTENVGRIVETANASMGR